MTKPMIKLKEKLTTIEMEPKLYFLVMTSVAQKQYQVPNTYVHWGVYHTLEEAKATALNKMQETAPRNLKYMDFTWAIAAEVVMPAADIERLFDEHKAKIDAELRKRKNTLMKQIISGGDIGLFHRHIKQFNRQELQYIKDHLTKTK